MEFEQCVPEAVDPGEWDDETILLLGAPYIGKSHLFDGVEHLTVAHTVAEALDSSTHEYVVLDEFYRTYRAATGKEKREFEAWLARRDGICLAARPRAFDWLLEHDDVPLSPDVLDALDAAYHLRYDPEDDRERAIDTCVRIGGSGEDGLDRGAVGEHLDEVLRHREYEFDSPEFRAALGTDTYSATLVPGLVAYFSGQLGDDRGAIVSQSIAETSADLGREFFENLALSELIDKATTTEFFSRETLTAVRSTVGDLGSRLADGDPIPDSAGSLTSSAAAGSLAPVLGPAAAGGAALALWVGLRHDDDPDRTEVFDVLAGEELTPTAKVELERELDLPPRTIDNFQRLTRGEDIERLLRYREQVDGELESLREKVSNTTEHVDERLEDVEDRLGDLEQHLETHDDVFAALDEAIETIEPYEADLARLEETAATVEAHGIEAEVSSSFVSAAIRDSTGTLSDLEATILLDEKRLLRESDIEGSIPYHGSEDTDIVRAVEHDESGVVVLRGTHGTGKSTAAMRACRTLAARGYDVKLPYFENSSAEFIERSLAATDRKTVVFAFYKRGTSDDNVVRNERHLRLLLDWLERGRCDAVVLECREELYSSFTQLDTLVEDTTLTRHFRDREEVEFRPFEPDDERVREIVDWVLAELFGDDVDDRVATASFAYPELFGESLD